VTFALSQDCQDGSANCKRKSMERIAVTGSSGFVGQAVVQHLRTAGHDVIGVSRKDLPTVDLSPIETIVHCAALAHRKGAGEPSLQEYDDINHRLTVELANRAKAASVKRIIFISTINVVAGNPGPLNPRMPYSPTTEYGRTKAAAEQSLLRLTGIESVVLRPPLVFGAGAPGNLRALMKLCALPVPLPFGLVQNVRSLVSIESLARAIDFLASAKSEAVAGRVFHVSDQPISTSEIVRHARKGMGRDPGLFPVPPLAMRWALKLTQRGSMADQLLGDLVVDSSDLIKLGWQPAPDFRRHLVAMGKAAIGS
jgi:UDP-glucose 4-epimerase